MSKERVVHAIQAQLAMADPGKAEKIAKTVTGLLCRRLDRGEVENLIMASSGFEDCTLVRGELPETFDSEAFLETLGKECSLDPQQTEQAARAAFRALKFDLPLEEVEGVAGQLPLKLKVLWIEA